ncbi:MAG: D-alanyl-D-alanine carboxypeptidase family protein [Solirubrobacteraceae bacterium]
MASLTVLVAVVLAYLAFALLRPLPSAIVTAAGRSASFPGRPPSLGWPDQGQAAVGVQGAGLIGSRGSGRSTPIASLAKVMTAYVVLRDHPLHAGGNGPVIELSPADVGVYRADSGAGQSVVAVQAGERLTERQALEALLLPSGNNIATLLAQWDAGSQRAFVAKMNVNARRLGLLHTHYVDASGVRAGTISTAGDQVRLAMRAMEFPVFRQIVAMPQASLPVAGRQHNLDGLLGQDGIVGIKTGTTSQAGGCFLFAARRRLAGRMVTVIGAVLHQLAGAKEPSLTAAFNATKAILAATQRVLVSRRVVQSGEALAWATAPWTDPVALRAAGSVSLIGWRELRIQMSIVVRRRPAVPITVGQNLAGVVIAAGEQRVSLRLLASRALAAPSLAWRLTHP